MDNENRFDEEDEPMIDSDVLYDEVADLVSDLVPDAIENEMEDIVEDVTNTIMSNGDLLLKDGSCFRIRPMMRIVNKQRNMSVRCFGSLRIQKVQRIKDYDNLSMRELYEEKDGRLVETEKAKQLEDVWELNVQTWITSWETLAYYKTKEEASDALMRVNQAILDGCECLEL